MKVLVVCDISNTARDIQALIESEPLLEFIVSTTTRDSKREIERLQPQIVWIELGSAPVRGLSHLAELFEAHRELVYWVSYGELDAELMRTAYRLGASEYLDQHSWTKDVHEYARSFEERRRLSCRRKAAGGDGAFGDAPAGENKRGAVMRTGSASEPRNRSKAAVANLLLATDAGHIEAQELQDLIGTQKRVRARTVNLSSAVEEARSALPDAVWLDMSVDPQKSLMVLTSLKEKIPNLPVLVSHSSADPELIRAAYRRGAADFLDRERWRTDLPTAFQSLFLWQRADHAGTFLSVAGWTATLSILFGFVLLALIVIVLGNTLR